MATIIFGIIFIVLLLFVVVGGIKWIVDGVRTAKGTYTPSNSEVAFSHILLGFFITMMTLSQIIDVIIYLMK